MRDQLAATNLASCKLTKQDQQMQKLTSSPVQYCVWEGSVKIPSKLGRRRSIGLRFHFNNENWIESMESRWSSSGTFSQDSLHWEFSLRLQILVEIQNMMTEIQCEPEQFQGRIVFMSIYNDIVRGEKNKVLFHANSKIVTDNAK